MYYYNIKFFHDHLSSFAPNKKSYSPKLRAGYLGGVTWTFHNKQVKEARKNLGLPNSMINDTDIPKATKFVFG